MLREFELLPDIVDVPSWNRGRRAYFIGTTAAIIAASVIGAGSAVGGAAIKASGAKSAAATQSAAGNAAANDINAATTAAQTSGQTGIDQANDAIDKGLTASGSAIDAG